MELIATLSLTSQGWEMTLLLLFQHILTHKTEVETLQLVILTCCFVDVPSSFCKKCIFSAIHLTCRSTQLLAKN